MHAINKQEVTILKNKYNPYSIGTDRLPNH
jgi:hypothetical protein